MNIFDVVNSNRGARLLSIIKKGDLHNELVKLTSFLSDKSSYAQRIWHIRNNQLHNIKCFSKLCTENAHFNVSKCIYVCCSKECKMQFIKQNNIEKYGVKMPSMLPEFKNKMIDSFKKNVDTEQWNKKRKETVRKKYGVDFVSQSEEIKNKTFATNLEKYGVKIPSQSEIVKEKIKNSVMKGITGSVDKRKKTLMGKYGVDDPMKLEWVKDKVFTDDFKEIMRGVAKDNLQERLGCEYNIIKYNKYEPHEITHNKCGNKFSIGIRIICERIRNEEIVCSNCNPHTIHILRGEKQLLNFIKSIYGGIIEHNTRDMIKPYELDIYIPDKKIAIEFNGVIWHNDSMKDKNYHRMKTDMCADIGVRLIHIYENDWFTKKSIIKSVITNALAGTNNRIYARKCKIKEISLNDFRNFIVENHIQGFMSAHKYYGLFHEDELVEVMSFRKKLDEWEISRLCTKMGSVVIGGANKLFKHFISKNNPKRIISYCDRGVFGGNTYINLGMKLIKITNPSCFYVQIRTFEKIGRRKVALMEGSISEKKSLLEEMGFVCIYNSGNYLFEWINN